MRFIAERHEGLPRQEVDMRVSGETTTKQITAHMSIEDMQRAYADRLTDMRLAGDPALVEYDGQDAQTAAIRGALVGEKPPEPPTPRTPRIRRNSKR
jgi:hypothetical protein